MSYDPCMYAGQLEERRKEAQNYLWCRVASTGHKRHLAPVVQHRTTHYTCCAYIYIASASAETLQCVLSKSGGKCNRPDGEFTAPSSSWRRIVV